MVKNSGFQVKFICDKAVLKTPPYALFIVYTIKLK